MGTLSGIYLRNGVLFLAQQHVAFRLAADPRQEAPVGRQKAQAHITLGACPHQARTGTRVAETDDIFQVVQWQAHAGGFIFFDHHVFTVQAEKGFGAGDIQYIGKFYS